MDTGSSETRVRSSPSSHPIDPGGFAPGTVLADRYRIVALAGRGGMGEVYRADDLKLGQTVALKFLPAGLEHDAAARERLLAEVRSARTVSHPNVCRVYDVGELAGPALSERSESKGRVFLTMEYIDGEDLASLLRRIGRLPAAKALEVARQLCAGLAAAHEKGLLHRDLKPANVMIDGRGHARITDFGLALRLADELESARSLRRRSGSPEQESRGSGQAGGGGHPVADVAGTVAYMAPERFEGKPATVQSDLYALGLILYETYTGKPAFKADTFRAWQRAHSDSTPTSPAVLATDVEPAVERAILRCLEKDPARRPASAAQVAAALPGGDPLAAAIAAGETPSPELVAASGEEGTLPRAKAWLLLVSCVLTLVVAASALQWVSLFNIVPWEGGPEALQSKARAVLRSLGYDEVPRDYDWWTLENAYRLKTLASRASTAQQFADAARTTPTPVWFLYRQSPTELRPYNVSGSVVISDPPPQIQDDALIGLDSLGRLLYLRVVPPALEPDPKTIRDPDWRRVLAAAGLSDVALTAEAPLLVPPVAFDARQAWSGLLDGDRFRFEAAAFRGRILFARWVERGDREPLSNSGPAQTPPRTYAVTTVWFLLLLAIVPIARHNMRLGRGDRRGASRVASVVLALGLVFDLASRHWVPNVVFAWAVVCTKLGKSFFFAAVVWASYIALEPFVRRVWPDLLIGWARLVDGRWRDPLVGRGLLAGVALGAAIPTIETSAQIVGRLLGIAGTAPTTPGRVESVISFAASIVNSAYFGIVTATGLVALMVGLRLLLRSERAVVVAAAAAVAVFSWEGNPGALQVAQAVIVGVLSVVFLRRYGLLAFAVAITAWTAVNTTPWTFDLTKWFAGRQGLTIVFLMALALWGFRNVLGKQSAFPAGALDGQ
jgi:hypothetical protein